MNNTQKRRFAFQFDSILYQIEISRVQLEYSCISSLIKCGVTKYETEDLLSSVPDQKCPSAVQAIDGQSALNLMIALQVQSTITCCFYGDCNTDPPSGRAAVKQIEQTSPRQMFDN